MAMSGIDPLVLHPGCFGFERERENGQILLRQWPRALSKPPCVVSDDIGDVRGCVAADRVVIRSAPELKMRRHIY